jgi:hypothetical protein
MFSIKQILSSCIKRRGYELFMTLLLLPAFLVSFFFVFQNLLWLDRNRANLNSDFPAGLGYGTTVSFCANGTTCCGPRCCVTGIEPDNTAPNNTSNTLAASTSISSSAKFSAVKVASLTDSLCVVGMISELLDPLNARGGPVLD